MKKIFTSMLLVFTLAFTSMFQYACSTAWVSKLDTIIAAAAPALINVLNIVSIAEGKPVNTALEAKITADAANLKVVAADLAAASAAAAPTVCAQTQAAAQSILADSQAVFQIVQVSSAASQTNALLVFQAADAIIVTVTSLIPSCASPVVAMSFAKAKLEALDANALVSNYNTVLVKPTGKPLVDAYNKKHKIHAHSFFKRVISVGHEK